jgi:DNA-binding response OmpR family regulator
MAEWRVLVVDDDTHMLDLMTRRLGRMGLQADRAQDGETAVALVGKTAYDLILTDIYMPGGSGLDILRKAKENDPHVQVIVVTGSATLDNAVEALNMGAFSYLAKPFDHMSVFDNAVTRALEFRRLIRDNQRLAEIQRRRGDMLEAEVTDRIRQMRRKQQDMIDLLARLPEGVLVVDAEGRILLSNAPAEAWLAREARFEVQPLRRYLSTLTPPRRATRSETEIDGVFLELTAQPLPSEEGKPRTLVTIGEAKGEAGDVRGHLAVSVRTMKMGLDWLAREPLEERDLEVVRRLTTQVAAIEAALKADGGEVVQVEWTEVASGADRTAHPAAHRGRETAEERAAARDEWIPAKPQWPPPRAGSDDVEEEAPPRRDRPIRKVDEQSYGTVILNEEVAETEPGSKPAHLGSEEEPEAESTDLQAGLSRLLEHLAVSSPPAEEEVAPPIAGAELEPTPEALPAPELASPAARGDAVQKRTSGLLGKIRRDGKQPVEGQMRVEDDVAVTPLDSEPEVAPKAPPAPASEPASSAAMEAPVQKRTSGLLGKIRREGKQPVESQASADEKPKPVKGTGKIPAAAGPAPEPTPQQAPEGRLGSGPLSRRRTSGLLGKVRRSQATSDDAVASPAAEAPPESPAPAEAHPPAEPPPAEGALDQKDLSKLLESVREAAGVNETGEPIKPKPAAGKKNAPEPPAPPPLTPPPGKRGAIWPPPLPSETDEE